MLGSLRAFDIMLIRQSLDSKVIVVLLQRSEASIWHSALFNSIRQCGHKTKVVVMPCRAGVSNGVRHRVQVPRVPFLPNQRRINVRGGCEEIVQIVLVLERVQVVRHLAQTLRRQTTCIEFVGTVGCERCAGGGELI